MNESGPAGNWLELTFSVAGAEAEPLAELLEALGAVAVTLTSEDDAPIFETETGATGVWGRTRVAALAADAVHAASMLARLREERSFMPLADPRITPVVERDWATAWQSGFQPLCFGGRLWVRPSWCAPVDPGGLEIVLDPGMAFGTGTHATTALCLEWLAQSPDLNGRVAVDYGCGSGILALACAVLGAREVWAVDVDAAAIEITRANAELNGLADRVRAVTPDALECETADIIVANILLDALCGLAPLLASRLRAGGHIALSGLLTAQTDACAAAYAPYFELETPRMSDGWALLHGRRRTHE